MDASHRISDTQSLRLNQAAVDLLTQQPRLLGLALATLDRWDRVAPINSKPLRDEWRDILLHGPLERALARTDLGQQLRQASPLGRVLPAAQRLAIIRACKGRNSNT